MLRAIFTCLVFASISSFAHHIPEHLNAHHEPGHLDAEDEIIVGQYSIFLGGSELESYSVNGEHVGLFVKNVEPDSELESMGVAPRNIITVIDGMPLTSSMNVLKAIKDFSKDSAIEIIHNQDPEAKLESGIRTTAQEYQDVVRARSERGQNMFVEQRMLCLNRMDLADGPPAPFNIRNTPQCVWVGPGFKVSLSELLEFIN